MVEPLTGRTPETAQERHAPANVPRDGRGTDRAGKGVRAPPATKRCERCGAELDGGRPDRRFCGGACRARASRERSRARLRAELAAELEELLVRAIREWEQV